MHCRVPPTDLPISPVAIHAIIECRDLVYGVLVNDGRAGLFQKISSTNEMQSLGDLRLREFSSIPVEVFAKAVDGEVFLSAKRNDTNEVLFPDIPLVGRISLCTPSYREDSEFVLSRCLETRAVYVMDDRDHEVLRLIEDDRSKERYAVVRNQIDQRTEMVSVDAVSFRQPLTHWPTRMLIHSMIREFEAEKCKPESGVSSEQLAIHVYLLEKALGTGHVDTVAINPIQILRQAHDFMQDNFVTPQAMSLATIVERYADDLEQLEDKYAEFWPRFVNAESFSPR